MGELFATFSDIMFLLVIGYLGAIKFLYVVRHLYHWSFNIDGNGADDGDDNLVYLQQNLRQQLTEATNQENITGYSVMRDGIYYKDGFRLDPDGFENEAQEREGPLSCADIKIVPEKSERYKQLEEEYAKQKKLKKQIEDDLRKAEEAYNLQMRHLINEVKIDVQQTGVKKEVPEALQIIVETIGDHDSKEETPNVIESKKITQIAQGENELTKLSESTNQMVEASEHVEVKYDIGREIFNIGSIAILTETNSEQIVQSTIEKSKEFLRKDSLEINEQNLHNDILDNVSAENDPYVLLSIKPNLNDTDKNKKDVFVTDHNYNERINDGNQLILADQRSSDNVLEPNIFNKSQEYPVKETEKQDEIIEEIISQKHTYFALKECPKLSSQNDTVLGENKNTIMDSSTEEFFTILKAQNEEISSSEDSEIAIGSSIMESPPLFVESKKSLSLESGAANSSAGNNILLRTRDVEHVILEDDDNVTPLLYTEDYLRSLDGIKNKKKDRSLHRRVFKKQRSSGSSNSSMESRTSRDEELEVFTSLEEEEMKRIGENFQPIIYKIGPPIKSETHQAQKSKKNAVNSMKEESNGSDKTFSKIVANVPLKISALDNSTFRTIDQEKESNYQLTKRASKDELNTTGALAITTKPKPCS